MGTLRHLAAAAGLRGGRQSARATSIDVLVVNVLLAGFLELGGVTAAAATASLPPPAPIPASPRLLCRLQVLRLHRKLEEYHVSDYNSLRCAAAGR